MSVIQRWETRVRIFLYMDEASATMDYRVVWMTSLK
jgi:hypothetical protein